MADDKDAPPAAVGGEAPAEGTPEVDIPPIDGKPMTADTMKRPKPVPTGPKIDISRAIQDLDKLMHHMKHQRRLCDKQMEEDKAAIAELQKEIDSLTPKLKVVDQANAERTQRKQLLVDQVADLDTNFTSVSRNLTALIRKTNRNSQSLNTKEASQRLEATRGFSTRTTTTDLIHNRKPRAKPSSAPKVVKAKTPSPAGTGTAPSPVAGEAADKK